MKNAVVSGGIFFMVKQKILETKLCTVIWAITWRKANCKQPLHAFLFCGLWYLIASVSLAVLGL